MIDWIACLRAVEPKLKRIGCGGGTCSYMDPVYGEVDFLWNANKTKIEISWFDHEPICICGNGFGDIDCHCEWDAFQDGECHIKIFTHEQVRKYLQPTLF